MLPVSVKASVLKPADWAELLLAWLLSLPIKLQLDEFAADAAEECRVCLAWLTVLTQLWQQRGCVGSRVAVRQCSGVGVAAAGTEEFQRSKVVVFGGRRMRK